MSERQLFDHSWNDPNMYQPEETVEEKPDKGDKLDKMDYTGSIYTNLYTGFLEGEKIKGVIYKTAEIFCYIRDDGQRTEYLRLAKEWMEAGHKVRALLQEYDEFTGKLNSFVTNPIKKIYFAERNGKSKILVGKTVYTLTWVHPNDRYIPGDYYFVEETSPGVWVKTGENLLSIKDKLGQHKYRAQYKDGISTITTGFISGVNLDEWCFYTKCQKELRFFTGPYQGNLEERSVDPIPKVS